jgi:hypothetical protein
VVTAPELRPESPEAGMSTKKRTTTKQTAAKRKVSKPAMSRGKTRARIAAVAKTPKSRAAAAPAKRETKKGIVAALLGRAEGASIEELTAATGWQAHSVRAVLTGFRKSGQDVARSKDEAGTTRYRLAGVS